MAWRIGEILLQKKLITWEDLSDGLEEQRRTKEFLGEILVKKKKVHIHFLYQALAEQFHLTYVDLERTRINEAAVQRIPGSIAQKYNIIPIDIMDRTLLLGIANPLSVWPQEELKKIADMDDVKIVLCLPSAVHKAIEASYPQPQPGRVTLEN